MKLNNIYVSNHRVNFDIAHQIDSIMDMKRIIRDFNPELILDFGTYSGGTVAVFNDACPSAVIHSYDNKHRKAIIKKIINDNIHYHLEDILNNISNNLLELLKSNKRKFIYCDNGNKPKEMNSFVPLINSGDLIGVHDWNTEIKINDIKEISPLLNPIEHELFQKNKWMTRFWIKK